VNRLAIAFTAAVVAVACNPKSLRPGYCHTNADCRTDERCSTKTFMCERADGSVEDGRDGGDAADADAKPYCKTNGDCADGGANVCQMDGGMCVECLEDSHCAAKSVNTPICEARTCRACKTDNECPEPEVCLSDGHCATSGEVIFVEFSASGCPSADGSATNPYCSPNDAVGQLADGRNVIVIRGAAADRMILNTVGIAPVVIGKNNASIAATAATAIQVSSDSALIRDLLVTGGTAATSKGIIAAGSSTTLTLVNVTLNLGSGLGIQADTGAELVMDRCTVTNNSVGGLLINGAGYDIQNSIFAANGYGVQFNAPKGPSQFRFNTIVGTVAAFCELTNPQMLSDSIVVGANTNCVLPNTVTTMPAFKATPPYRLSAAIGCPQTPVAPLPTHDIDGDPRLAPLDCGADQFVQ
jgi:hypothetical protein